MKGRLRIVMDIIVSGIKDELQKEFEQRLRDILEKHFPGTFQGDQADISFCRDDTGATILVLNKGNKRWSEQLLRLLWGEIAEIISPYTNFDKLEIDYYRNPASIAAPFRNF